MEEKIVAIVGSGISGLSAALDLANHGVKSVIFDKNSFHGGYATNFWKEGFRFEASLHYVGPIFKKALNRLGLSRKVKLIEIKKAASIDCREVKDSCKRVDFKFNDNGISYIRYLVSKYPDEEKSIKKLFSIGDAILPLSDDMVIDKVNPLVAMIKHPKAIYPASRYLSKTSKVLLDELFVNEDLKKEISSLAIILGTPVDVMAAIPRHEDHVNH